MAETGNGKREPIKRRLSLGNSGAARNSLCKLIRQRYNNSIDSALFCDLVYAINVLLGFDKHILESELNKRIEQLEQYVRGEGGTVVDSAQLDSPYAQALKKQLQNESKVNADLNAELLSLKRRLAENRADSLGATDA